MYLHYTCTFLQGRLSRIGSSLAKTAIGSRAVIVKPSLGRSIDPDGTRPARITSVLEQVQLRARLDVWTRWQWSQEARHAELLVPDRLVFSVVRWCIKFRAGADPTQGSGDSRHDASRQHARGPRRRTHGASGRRPEVSQ